MEEGSEQKKPHTHECTSPVCALATTITSEHFFFFETKVKFENCDSGNAKENRKHGRVQHMYRT